MQNNNKKKDLYKILFGGQNLTFIFWLVVFLYHKCAIQGWDKAKIYTVLVKFHPWKIDFTEEKKSHVSALARSRWQ